MILDESLIDRRRGDGVPRQFLVRFDSGSVEVFLCDTQEISASASHLEKPSGRTVSADEIESSSCVQTGKSSFLVKINALQVAVGVTNPLGSRGSGVSAEGEVRST